MQNVNLLCKGNQIDRQTFKKLTQFFKSIFSMIKFMKKNNKMRCSFLIVILLQKFIPTLTDSYSSDRTFSTPSSEYPCGFIEPLLTNDIHHEYEQIKYDSSSNYYCLVYCRQCANYHPTSSSLNCQTSFIRSCYQNQCSCHLPSNNHLFELQPMLTTNNRS